jgi:integrase
VQVFKRGVRKSKSFDTKAAAQVWARRLEAELDAGEAGGHVASRETVGALIERYVREVKPAKRWGRTKDDSLALLRTELGSLTPKELTPQQVIAYAQKRAKSGAGPVTVGMELTYLGGVLRIARAVWRLDVANPVPDAREALKLLGMVGKSRSRDRVATEAEIAKVKLAWRSEVPVAVIDFALETTMRLGEICRIAWADLDGDTILVRDRKHPREKLGNNQRVPLLGGAPAILAGLERREARVWPYPEDTVGAAWQRACKRAKVVDVRFHDLRHTGITRLFQRGFSIEQVALVSGHRDWAMLKRYTHVTAKDLLRREAASAAASG